MRFFGLRCALGRERTTPRRPCAYTRRASRNGPRVSCYAQGLLLAERSRPAISRGHPRRARATAPTPNAVGPPLPPAGVGGPANVDRSRFPDGTAPVGASVGTRRPGVEAPCVRARASAEGGVRRLAGRRRVAAGRSSLSARADAPTERRAPNPKPSTTQRKPASERRSIPRPFTPHPRTRDYPTARMCRYRAVASSYTPYATSPNATIASTSLP
jgi:hypothetical protein